MSAPKLADFIAALNPVIVEIDRECNISSHRDFDRARPCYRILDRTFAPVELRMPDRLFDLFDQCTLRGLRFVVTEFHRAFHSYDRYGRRPVFEWVYTVSVFASPAPTA